MSGHRRLLVTWAFAVPWLLSCQSAPPAFVVRDPVDGGEVPVSCAGVDTEVCRRAADAALAYLTSDYAAVEAISVEALADPPADAVFATRVTLDHEMFLNAGLQAYRVVQPAVGSIQVSPED